MHELRSFDRSHAVALGERALDGTNLGPVPETLKRSVDLFKQPTMFDRPFFGLLYVLLPSVVMRHHRAVKAKAVT
ncbi:MAG TPA: hypothetical protein VGF95_06505 [Solirubrobacteraceae bacterium]